MEEQVPSAVPSGSATQCPRCAAGESLNGDDCKQCLNSLKKRRMRGEYCFSCFLQSKTSPRVLRPQRGSAVSIAAHLGCTEEAVISALHHLRYLPDEGVALCRSCVEGNHDLTHVRDTTPPQTNQSVHSTTEHGRGQQCRWCISNSLSR
jgi:hypothetical protein